MTDVHFTHKSQFSQAPSITVYEHWNRGAPRWPDNYDLRQGVFYEQDEFFFHIFKMAIIFDFHNGGIFNKGNDGGWIVHLGMLISISIIGLTIEVKITKSLR